MDLVLKDIIVLLELLVEMLILALLGLIIRRKKERILRLV
jgi:hypothetical protein